MPTHSPKDVFKALKHLKYIPVGAGIKVIQMFNKEGSIWYRVLVVNQKMKFLGSGWINSTALLGQELEILQ